MLFVSATDIGEDLQCLFSCSGFHDHLLEPALQGSVFLDAVAIFIQGGGTDTLYHSARKCRFHDICGIHCSWSTSGSHESVYLIYKYNNVGIVFQFLEQCLESFLELSAILCSRHDGCHVEIHDTLVEEEWGCLLVDNHLCQSLDNGTLSDARFAYEHGVVFLASAENLHHPEDLFLPAHHGV